MDMPVEAAASRGSHHHLPHSPQARYDTPRNDGDPTGPLATTSCEPRQAWKGAAAAADSGAGVWLVGSPPLPPERCPHGLRSTPGKCVWVNSSSRLRLEPPPGGERTRRRRSRRAAPKGVSRRRRRIIPPSPPCPTTGTTRFYRQVSSVKSDQRLPHSLCAGYDTPRNDGDPAGPLATTSCEPRQSRKGRAVAADSIWGVRLVGSPPVANGEVSERLKEHAWKVCMG